MTIIGMLKYEEQVEKKNDEYKDEENEQVEERRAEGGKEEWEGKGLMDQDDEQVDEGERIIDLNNMNEV